MIYLVNDRREEHRHNFRTPTAAKDQVVDAMVARCQGFTGRKVRWTRF